MHFKIEPMRGNIFCSYLNFAAVCSGDLSSGGEGQIDDFAAIEISAHQSIQRILRPEKLGLLAPCNQRHPTGTAFPIKIAVRREAVADVEQISDRSSNGV